MSDTGSTPGSGSAPFKTYQMSLRRAKREAAEAREATDALKTLERTVPLWWQMVILARRDVTHRAAREWQEEASELIDSAQADFLSGLKSKLHEGAKKMERVYTSLNSTRNVLQEKLQEKKENLGQVKEKIYESEKNLENNEDNISRKKEKINKEKKGRKTAVVKSIFLSAGIPLIILIPGSFVLMIIDAIFGVDLGILFIVLLVVLWAAIAFGKYEDYKDEDISKLKKGIEKEKRKKGKKEKEIGNMEKEKSNLESAVKSLREDLEIIEPDMDYTEKA